MKKLENSIIIHQNQIQLPKRKRESHKGEYGRLLIYAGSVGYTGAPVLAADGALLSGAGLVFLGVPQEIYPICAVKCTSAMPFPVLTEDSLLEKGSRCDAAILGPGLGREKETTERVRRLLATLACPVVLDADGLYAIRESLSMLQERKGITILTPHEGEFSMLTGCTLPIENREQAAKAFAEAYQCILVLKGHRTILATPKGEIFLNATGNPGMAKGGSGDILSGILGGLMVQKQLRKAFDVTELVRLGVYLHGAAGDRAAEQYGEYSMLPEHLLAALPSVIREHTEH